MSPITVDQLNRTTLLRQGLLERSALSVEDAIRRFGPLQSQSPVSPYLALWNRLADFDPLDLEDAYKDGVAIKASLLRLTLHTVLAEDHSTYRAAMMRNLRGAGFGDRRFTTTGISVERAEQLTAELEVFLHTPRTRREIEADLARLIGEDPAPGLWRALRLTAPWRHYPSDGEWLFSPPARFVAIPSTDSIDSVEATAEIIRRYLQAFGPATRRDIGQFTILRLTDVDKALDRIEDLVRLDGPEGVTVDLHGLPLADVGPAPVRLLPMWDSPLLAYANRARVIPEVYRKHVLRRNGDVLPCILIDGWVAGVWRAIEGGIEVATFADLSADAVEEARVEAESLAGLITQRDPGVYSRHQHWWKDLPTTTRLRVKAH